MKRFALSFILASTFIINFNSIRAFAHIPVFSKSININNAVSIKDPQVSYAVYGEIKERGQVDYIKFFAKQGDPIYIEISVPNIDDNDKFTPSFALIAKGLPSYDRNVPFSIPDKFGYAIFNSYSNSDKSYEPFTQTSYIMRQKIKMLAPNTGEYYIAVYSPEKAVGKYCIAVGEKDRFKVLDIIMFPILWLKVKFWYNPLRAISILIVLSAIVMGIIYCIKQKNRR